MQQCNVQKTLLNSKEHVLVSVSLSRSALCLLCLIVIHTITDHSTSERKNLTVVVQLAVHFKADGSILFLCDNNNWFT